MSMSDGPKPLSTAKSAQGTADSDAAGVPLAQAQPCRGQTANLVRGVTGGVKCRAKNNG